MNPPRSLNPPPYSLPLYLLGLAVLLMPFGRSVEAPMGMLSILGLVALGYGPRLNSGAPWRTLVALYLAFALPMVLALPDAVAFEKSLITTVGSLRYVLYCCLMLWFFDAKCDDPTAQGTLLNSLGLVVALALTLWCCDGLLQLATGRNVLGYAPAGVTSTVCSARMTTSSWGSAWPC